MLTEMLEIKKALEKNKNGEGRFKEPYYTLGWITAAVDRALNEDD